MSQKNWWMRNVLHYAIYLIMILSTITLFYAGPRLEAVLYPPIAHFEVAEVQRIDDGRVLVAGLLYKTRGECAPIEIVATTGGPPGDPNTEILNIDFQDNVRTRPRGGQTWGPWIIHDEGQHGPIFTIFATHRCHSFWDVHTVLYRGPTSAIFGEKYGILSGNGL